MTSPANLTILARDGFELACTVRRPASPPSLVVLFAGAMGVKRGFYDRYAAFLEERGAAAVTFDYRGIGDSRPLSLRGFPATLRDWGEKDIPGAIDWVTASFPGVPLAVVAHSVGGQVLGLADNVARVERILAVAVQSGYWRHWSFPYNLRVAALWYALIPALAPALSYFPSHWLGLGNPLPAGVALDWARWGRDPDYLHGRHAPPSVAHFGSFRGAILGYSFSDDPLAPKRAVAAFLPRYRNADLEHRHLRPPDLGVNHIGHWDVFRDRLGDRIWEAWLDWLKDCKK